MTFDIKKIRKVGTLPDNVIKKCRDFTERTMKVYNDEYKERNQFIREKVSLDFFTGQLGVAHIVALCEELGFEVNNIKGEKGINCDIGSVWGKNELIIDSVNYRIKAQSINQSRLYGTSWIFNNVPRDPILDNPDANVIFVLVDDLIKNERLGADIYPSYKMRELKFTQPIRKELLGKKLVVLEENLPCYEGIRTRQLTLC